MNGIMKILKNSPSGKRNVRNSSSASSDIKYTGSDSGKSTSTQRPQSSSIHAESSDQKVLTGTPTSMTTQDSTSTIGPPVRSAEHAASPTNIPSLSGPMPSQSCDQAASLISAATGDDRGKSPDPNKSNPQHPESATVQGARNHFSYTMFTGSHIVINDGRFVQTNSAPSESHRGFNLLAEATSPSAFHNSGHHLPACLSDSQIEVIGAIKGWISDNKAVPIMWLYGPAGAGKSFLAKSMAMWAEQESLLLASFLFSRSDPSRNGIHRFIPTLTYSVVQSIPETRRMIEQAIDSDPHIFSRSLDAQISNLIIRPLSTLVPSTRHTLPHVLVVDGLDECQDETAPKTIVKLFSSVLSTSNLGWKVLITSRPTQAIRALFDDGSMQHLLTRLALTEGRFRENAVPTANPTAHTSTNIPESVSTSITPKAAYNVAPPLSQPRPRVAITLKNIGESWITYSYQEDDHHYCHTLQDHWINEKPNEFYVNVPYTFTMHSGLNSKDVRRVFTMEGDWDLAQYFR